MLVGRWFADGALGNRRPALPCRQDYFSTTGTRAGADWSRCFAVLMCAHRPTLYFRTSAFTLAPLVARRCGTHCSMRFSCVFSQIRPKNRIYGLVEVDFLVFGLFFMFRFQTQFDVGMPSRRRFGDRLRLCFHIFFAVAKMFIPFHRTPRLTRGAH